MKFMTFGKATMLCAALLSLNVTGAHALTDMEALEEGMMPIEEATMAEMNAVLTPGLNSEGVARAVQTHRVVIAVNKKTKGKGAQTLTLYENGEKILEEKISTGRNKHEKAKSGRWYWSITPAGYFRPTEVYRDYWSGTWQAPMPNAVFFRGKVAVHATTKSHYAELGTNASGACVRTKLETSQLIREKVMDSGLGSQAGQFGVKNVGYNRNIITKNTVSVDQIDRNTGDILNAKVDSWDTVVIVYEE